MEKNKEHALHEIIDNMLAMNKTLIKQNLDVLEMMDQQADIVKRLHTILCLIDPDLVDFIMNN